MKLKNNKELKIEQASKSDAKQIIAYLNIVGGESNNLLFGENEFHMSEEAEEHFIEEMKQSKYSTLLIGKVKEEIACIGSILVPAKERISHQAELALSVKKEYWGLGVGTHLMQMLIDYARQNKKTEILHLGVKCDNKTAIRLYKKMGFEEIGRYHKFFKINGIYYDEILMNLYL